MKASPGRGKLSPQVTDEGAATGITPHPALRATFPPRGEGFLSRVKSQKLIPMRKKKKAMENFHRFAGASCLTRTGDTLINSQVL